MRRAAAVPKNGTLLPARPHQLKLDVFGQGVGPEVNRLLPFLATQRVLVLLAVDDDVPVRSVTLSVAYPTLAT